MTVNLFWSYPLFCQTAPLALYFWLTLYMCTSEQDIIAESSREVTYFYLFIFIFRKYLAKRYAQSRNSIADRKE